MPHPVSEVLVYLFSNLADYIYTRQHVERNRDFYIIFANLQPIIKQPFFHRHLNK